MKTHHAQPLLFAAAMAALCSCAAESACDDSSCDEQCTSEGYGQSSCGSGMCVCGAPTPCDQSGQLYTTPLVLDPLVVGQWVYCPEDGDALEVGDRAGWAFHDDQSFRVLLVDTDGSIAEGVGAQYEGMWEIEPSLEPGHSFFHLRWADLAASSNRVIFRHTPRRMRLNDQDHVYDGDPTGRQVSVDAHARPCDHPGADAPYASPGQLRARLVGRWLACPVEEEIPVEEYDPLWPGESAGLEIRDDNSVSVLVLQADSSIAPSEDPSLHGTLEIETREEYTLYPEYWARIIWDTDHSTLFRASFRDAPKKMRIRGRGFYLDE